MGRSLGNDVALGASLHDTPVAVAIDAPNKNVRATAVSHSARAATRWNTWLHVGLFAILPSRERRHDTNDKCHVKRRDR